MQVVDDTIRVMTRLPGDLPELRKHCRCSRVIGSSKWFDDFKKLRVSFRVPKFDEFTSQLEIHSVIPNLLGMPLIWGR